MRLFDEKFFFVGLKKKARMDYIEMSKTLALNAFEFHFDFYDEALLFTGMNN
jgi:hypothetical protein